MTCWVSVRYSPGLRLGFESDLLTVHPSTRRSAGKESACNAGDPSSISGSGRSAREGVGCPLQYSGLENFVDGLVHGVAKSQTRLNDFHFHFTFHPSTHPLGVCCKLGFSPQHPSPLPEKSFYDLRSVPLLPDLNINDWNVSWVSILLWNEVWKILPNTESTDFGS